MRLSAEQSKRLAESLKRSPQLADEIIARLEAKGYEIDRGEYEPVDLGAEADVFARTALPAATLGILDPGPSPVAHKAGDINLPIVGDVQPSAVAGGLLGLLGPLMPALKAGKALVPGSGIARGAAQEGIAGGLIGAGEEAVSVAKGKEPSATGIIQAMLLDAAGFATLGLIGRGTMRLLKGAADKEAAGTLNKLTPEEKEAVTEVRVLMERNPDPRGPREQLPPSTEGGPAMEMGSGQPQLGTGTRGPRRQLLPFAEEGAPIEMGSGQPRLGEGARGPRQQLPPSTEGGEPIINPFLDPLMLGAGRRGPRERLPASTESGVPIRAGTGAMELPRFTQETAGRVLGKPQAVIELEHSAAELYRRVESGEIKSAEAMQAFQLVIEKGVPMQHRHRLGSKAREAFRRAEGVVPHESGAPVTADPQARASVIKPRRRIRKVTEMSPFQVLKNAGGLDTRTVDRLYAELPKESGGARAHLGKLRGGGMDVESLLLDARSNDSWARVLDRAGIHTHDDVARAVNDGTFFKKQSIAPDADAADVAFANRPLDYDPSLEGFEDRIPLIRTIPDLDAEIARIDDAAQSGDLTSDQVEDLLSQVSARGNDLYSSPTEAAPSPRAGSYAEPFSMEAPPARQAPPPKPQQEGMDLGDQRVLPSNPRRTSGSDRMEGTPLEQARVDETAAAERAAAPQGEIFQGPESSLAGEVLGKLKTGDSVALEMHDGKTRVGVLGTQEAPNTITLIAARSKYHFNAADVKTASKFTTGRGGVDDMSGPPTKKQIGYIYKLSEDLKRMGGEGTESNPRELSKDAASMMIRRLELERSEVRDKQLDDMMSEIDEFAQDPKGFRLDGGEVTGAKASDPEALLDEFGPDVFKDSSRLYGMGVQPEISKFGIMRNAIGKLIVERGLRTVRDVSKDTNRYLKILADNTKGMSRQDKFKLLTALDNDPSLARGNPAYAPIREMLDDLAQRLGLEKGDQIRHYFPHIFGGTLGRWRSVMAGRELGPTTTRRLAAQADQIDMFSGRLDIQAGVPLQKFFANMLPRNGADGFELDLDKALYTYITGAVRKIHWDSYLDFSLKKLRQLPTHDLSGKFPLNVRRQIAEHIAHAVGQPTSGSVTIARFWAEAPRFNAGVDRLVEWVGGAPERGLLQKSRRMGELNTKARLGTLTPAEKQEWANATPAQALNWLQKVIDDAQKYDMGAPTETPRATRYRAETALAIDDFRAALQDPFRRGFLAEQAYSWMALSKLGLNFSYGVVNLTQFLTNVVPKLDMLYTARGVRNFFMSRHDRPMLGGRRIDTVLDDLAVLQDTPKAQEFMDKRFGPGAKLKDVLNTPGRASERYMRGPAGLAAYEQHLARAGVKAGDVVTDAQHEAAITWARTMVDETLFPFNRVGAPKALRSPGMRLLLMFQSYPIHQMNFSAELIHNVFKNPSSADAWGALSKHVMAYMTLYAAGTEVGSNLWERTEHPVFDIMDLGSPETGDRDVFDLISGPFATALVQMAHQNWERAGSQLEPTIAKRARELPDVEKFLFGTMLEDRQRGGAPGGTRATTATK
ncbi:hypothetical protein [uncultured Mediterranean phage]|nr:hypothetical protein [uncultured Mediterranean phage]